MEKSLTEIILGVVTDSMRNDLEVYDAFFREAQNDEQIKELLDRYERSKWHDLRKDPSDLPGHEDEYLCRLQSSVGEIYYEVCHFYQVKEAWEQSSGPMYGIVVAWKYIELDEEDGNAELD